MLAMNYSSFAIGLRNAIYEFCPTLKKFDILAIPQCSEANKWVKGYDDGKNTGCLVECSKDHVVTSWPQNSYSVANEYVFYQVVRCKKATVDPSVYPCWAMIYVIFSYISFNDMRKCVLTSRSYVNDFLKAINDDEYDYVLYDT